MKNKKMWMVRAGESAKWIEDFSEHQVVAIGWHKLGKVDVGESREEITERAAKQWPNNSRSKIASGVGQIYRFLNEIKKGDGVVSYDPSRRVYLVGVIEGDPEYKPDLFEELPRVRAVLWKEEVPRDKLSVPTRNSLGSISTLFQLPPEATEEILKVQVGLGTDEITDPDEEDEIADELARDLRARSLEFIKDRISSLTWEEMQELVAGLLRAMGYKTRIPLPDPIAEKTSSLHQTVSVSSSQELLLRLNTGRTQPWVRKSFEVFSVVATKMIKAFT